MHKEKIEKKSLSSIVRALEEYDGCEIDVRLTRDRIPVIFHDARHNSQRLIKTNFRDLKGFLTLDTLIQHPRVIKLINDNGKTLWVEAKEDSNHRKRKDPSLRKETAHRLTKKLMDSGLHLENIRIISFCMEILVHVKGIRKLKIVPYLFSATDHYFPHYNHKTIFQLFQSLRQHMQEVKRLDFNGLLFSKHYLRGFFSIFHPQHEEIISWKEEDFILGTGAQTFQEEKDFKDFVVITDYRGDRREGRGENAGLLICHRGL
jgi:hypothetical protein